MKFEDYEGLSLVELRLAAKKLGIKSVTSYRKQELLNVVRDTVENGNQGTGTENNVENLAEENLADSVVEGQAGMQKMKAESPMGSEDAPRRMGDRRTMGNEDDKRYAYNRKAMTRFNEKQRDVGYGSNMRNNRNHTGNFNNGNYNNNRNYYHNGNNSNYNHNGNYNSNNYMNGNNYGNNGNYGNNHYGNNNNYGNNGNYGNNSYNNNYGNNNGGYSNHGNNGNYGNNSRYNNNNYNNDYGNNNSNGSGYNSDYNNSNASGGERQRSSYHTPTATEIEQLDSGEVKQGILEVLPEGYGFIRCDNYLPGDEDVYVSPAMIRKFQLRTGDILEGNVRIRNQNDKFGALLYLKKINDYPLDEVGKRVKFEQLTPVFPDEKIRLETPGSSVSMRMMDLISPIGKGQRGMIVSQPKTGKTTLLKQVAKAVKMNHPKMRIIVLLIDERPEEVTDIKESILGHNVEVIYSTFDELPENHKRVSEMVMERAKRLVEHGEDVMILLDSITRLARAYNLTVQPSGRTLSGGLDPAALHMPKRFFGSARNMREGGSLTILATALVDTGSKMDDVVFEEFKGTGNMELVLDRKLSERRVFPSIDLPKSSTRREDLLLTQEEMEATFLMRKAFNGSRTDEAVERIIGMFRKTKNNQEFIQLVKKAKIV